MCDKHKAAVLHGVNGAEPSDRHVCTSQLDEELCPDCSRLSVHSVPCRKADMRQLTFGTLTGLDLFQPPLSRLGYLHSPGTEDEIKPITHWLIGDLATKVTSAGLQRC